MFGGRAHRVAANQLQAITGIPIAGSAIDHQPLFVNGLTSSDGRSIRNRGISGKSQIVGTGRRGSWGWENRGWNDCRCRSGSGLCGWDNLRRFGGRDEKRRRGGWRARTRGQNQNRYNGGPDRARKETESHIPKNSAGAKHSFDTQKTSAGRLRTGASPLREIILPRRVRMIHPHRRFPYRAEGRPRR